MWDKRESTMMHRDQNTNFDCPGPEIPSMQTMRFPPPNGSLGGQPFAKASMKRKAMDMEPGHDGLFPRFLETTGGKVGHLLQREYPLQHEVALPPSLDSRMRINNSMHPNSSNGGSQYEAFQSYNMDNPLQTSGTKVECIEKTSFGNLRPSHYSEPSFAAHTVRIISETHDSRHNVFDTANQYEAGKLTSHHGQHNGLTEMSQVALRSDDVRTVAHGNNKIPYNPSLYPFSVPSSNMATFETSSLKAANENFHSNVGSFGQKLTQNRLFEEKEFSQITVLQDVSNASTCTSHCVQTFASSEGRKAFDAYQYHHSEMRSGISIKNDNLGAHLSLREHSGPVTSPMPVQTESYVKEGCRDNISGSFQTKSLEGAEGSNPANANHPSGEETSFGGDGLASRSVAPDEKLPLSLEKRTQSVAGKVPPLIVEKLWDGSIQLSTSTTVSAIAFFKSGEKAQDTKWPEHIEIKGKVRLQPFEKFIQELPRSRNRALMVISLCWKPGSSEAGLAGMKEVAKGYRESQRVGFAQISPGFDLYVCPRSDTIITILAKYGFFKGMAAVVEDMDSLIGCVIWRRGHTSLNPILKVSDRKRNPILDQHPSNSPEPSIAEINSPIMQVEDSESKQGKASSPPISSVVSTIRMVAENKVQSMDNSLSGSGSFAENKVVQSRDNSSRGSGGFQINSISEVTPSMPYNSPLIQVRPPAADKLDSTSFQESTRDFGVSATQAAELKKHDGDAEPVQASFNRPPRTFYGVPQQTKAQFSNGSYNFNYNSCPPPEPRNLVSFNSPFIRAQQPTVQNLDISHGCDPVQTSLRPESVPPSLPGPPSLHRIIQFSGVEHQAPAEDIPAADPSFKATGEQKNPSMGTEPQQKSSELDDDDDGDLPEFDFDAACGVSNEPASRISGSIQQVHFQVSPFNHQNPVNVVKNEGVPTPAPVKPMDVRQAPHPLGCPDRNTGNYQGHCTTLPTGFGELDSEKISADIPPSSTQQFPANKGLSSSCSLPRKSRWDDDDDDMPEWCPPDMEHIHSPEPRTVPRSASENAKELPLTPPYSMTTFRPPLQGRGSSHGYNSGMPVSRPAATNPALVHNRPVAGSVPADSWTSQMPYQDQSLRPSPRKFVSRPPISDGSWRRKRS